MIKCKYCSNDATVSGYREKNGITSKEEVCSTCYNLSNEGLIDQDNRNRLEKAIRQMRLNPEYSIRLCWNNTGEVIGTKGTYDIFNNLDELISIFDRISFDSPKNRNYTPNFIPPK